MEVVKAVSPVMPVTNGQTRPYLIKCDDGNEYYVKFKENPESSRVLVNEYVCGEIAGFFDIPITANRFIDINEEFIAVYGSLIEEHIYEPPTAGLHFGSPKVEKAYPITSAKLLNSAPNSDCLATILLFDHLIGNDDRISNAGNILVNGITKEIVVIDHTHAFDLGPIWEVQQLRLRMKEPMLPYNLSGYVYSKWVPYIKGNSPFSNFFNSLTRLTDDDLWNIISKTPDEWSLTVDEKEVLTEYLSYRKAIIHQVPELLKPSLPYWKGGS